MAWATGWQIAWWPSAESLQDDLPLRIDTKRDPFQDERLRVANLPVEPQKVTMAKPVSGAEKQVDIALFRKPGEVAGTRRAISEIIKWMNYVTDNRFITLAADLSDSINVEHGQSLGALRSGHQSGRYPL